jgi:TRAP-type C4-dicarboxylate transport system substrate-binding protein
LLSVFDEYLADEYEDVKLLGVFTVAGAAWAATKDVSTIDGLQGTKMVPYAAMTQPIIEAMGAVPVQMPVTEMYTGLSTGTIDATTVGYSNMTPPWNFWDVSSHLVENVPVQFAVFFVVMNKERYEGLSDEHRAIVDELAGEMFSMKGAEAFHTVETNAFGMLDGAEQMDGVTRISASDEERAKMDAAVAEGLEAIFADYASRGIENAEAIYNAINQ